MEKFLDLKFGVAGICVLLTIQILVKVGAFLWNERKQKDREKEQVSDSAIHQLTEVLEETTRAVQHLEMKLSSVEKSLAEFPKFKTDMRRLFAAVKLLTGEKWPEIRRQIMEDDIL